MVARKSEASIGPSPRGGCAQNCPQAARESTAAEIKPTRGELTRSTWLFLAREAPWDCCDGIARQAWVFVVKFGRRALPTGSSLLIMASNSNLFKIFENAVTVAYGAQRTLKKGAFTQRTAEQQTRQ